MQLWALGDYGRVAKLIAGMGTDLVTAAGVRAGQRVLDVAAGTGNASLPAARAGAKVTALDETPELLAEGRREAGDLPIDWVEGDATELPFEDGAFDVVLSCVGAMFAADHRAAARELIRVCRPDGVVALANWTPDGNAARLFQVVGRHRAAPPAADPPALWGEPGYVRGLFDGCAVETQVRDVVVSFTGTPAELATLYLTAFPPIVAARAELDDAGRAALDRDLAEFFAAENEGPAQGHGRWRYQWLLALVHR